MDKKDFFLLGMSVMGLIFILFLGTVRANHDKVYRAQQRQVDSLKTQVSNLLSAGTDTVYIDPVMHVKATITAYTPDSASCWPYNDGFTATMKDAKLPGVAVDPRRIPFGSIVVIDGVPYEADDTGQTMRDADEIHVDLRLPTRQEALEFGKQEKEIEVILR